MSETKQLTKPIVDALAEAGYFAMRLNSGLVKMGSRRIRLCPKGTADILICPANRMPVWAETKKQGNRTNKEQAEAQATFRETVERLGHTYVRAESLADVLGALEKGMEGR